MKNVVFIGIALTLFACTEQTSNNQRRIDSLQIHLADTYKPGFGEFMSSIQIHHAKLWFAGKNQNWQLADFEIKEIKESLDDIKKYCTDRPEIKEIGMIDLPLDSLTNAINQRGPAQFESSYMLLTNACNKCHAATDHAFNVIKVPDNPPFSNQDFGNSVK
ncbi:MAG: hypothetical protein ABI861_02525 [Panacibacter sp.]